ncbi:MAG: gamma-glutamyl-gamma-aminobutyrate hydrolase family protein [Clostridiaceae bacterium]|nr:gamma-glutamyl-gamma-aminobutyrate hydrolase family protein [Clostridiaceae bacterium]MDD5797450.1 gamma-glutamyl-gamma-aminobutyrate hydrolase family protein [Clostridiaceae bacterium]
MKVRRVSGCCQVIWKKSGKLGEICTVLDQMERQVLEYVIKEDKAVLGICRGIQYLNAMLGGSLYQKALWRHVIGEKCEIILIWNWKN